MANLSITKEYTVTLASGEVFSTQAASSVAVDNFVKREVTVPTASEVEILKVGAAVAAGTLTDIGAMVIINGSGTNFCRLRIEDSAAHTFDIKLEPLQAFDLYNTKLSVDETAGAFSAFTDFDTISAQFDNADGNLIILAGENC